MVAQARAAIQTCGPAGRADGSSSPPMYPVVEPGFFAEAPATSSSPEILTVAGGASRARRFAPSRGNSAPASEATPTPRRHAPAPLGPFGSQVVGQDGKTGGTVSRLVLHPGSQEVVAIVVSQGVLTRREVVVPINSVQRFGDEIRFTPRTSELAGL